MAQDLRRPHRMEGQREQDAPPDEGRSPIGKDIHPQEVRRGTVRQHRVRQPGIGEGDARGVRPRPRPVEDYRGHFLDKRGGHRRGQDPADTG